MRQSHQIPQETRRTLAQYRDLRFTSLSPGNVCRQSRSPTALLDFLWNKARGAGRPNISPARQGWETDTQRCRAPEARHCIDPKTYLPSLGAAPRGRAAKP